MTTPDTPPLVQSRYSPEEASRAIWVYLQHDQEALAPVSLEILGRSRQLADDLGWELVGLLIGDQVAPLAQAAFAHGADRVFLVEHPLLLNFSVDGYAHVAYQALLAHKPSVFLLGATADGRDLAGRLAVRLRTGLNADCTAIDIDPQRGVLVSEVSGFGGGVLALIEMPHHRPQMATVRPGVFPIQKPSPGRTGTISRMEVDLDPELIKIRTLQRQAGQETDLTQSEVLVVGGRGAGAHFEALHTLADLLGGEVGATRPPVDEGLIERERQIGQTGVVCRPKVALVFGASGAFHFLVGIQDADLVIAINNDPEAPIFEHVDYGVVADVGQVLPALIHTLQAVGEVSYE